MISGFLCPDIETKTQKSENDCHSNSAAWEEHHLEGQHSWKQQQQNEQTMWLIGKGDPATAASVGPWDLHWLNTV
jgi:hypothetical protein